MKTLAATKLLFIIVNCCLTTRICPLRNEVLIFVSLHLRVLGQRKYTSMSYSYSIAVNKTEFDLSFNQTYG